MEEWGEEELDEHLKTHDLSEDDTKFSCAECGEIIGERVGRGGGRNGGRKNWTNI